MTRSRLDRLGLGWVNFSGSHSELTQDDVKINFTNSGSLESLPWNVTGTEHFPPLGLFWSATQNNQLSNQHANLESHGHRCYKTRRWNIHAIYARFCLLAGNKPNISWPIIWIFWSIKFLAVKSTVCEKNETFLVSRSTFCRPSSTYISHVPYVIYPLLRLLLLRVYHEFRTWPASRWLDSSVGRTPDWHCRGHGFECRARLTLVYLMHSLLRYNLGSFTSTCTHNKYKYFGAL